MGIYEFEGKKPKIGKGAWVSESADIIGDVIIGDKCFIAPGARIRGDYGSIEIGDETSIEDNCVVHARPNEKCVIEDNVTVGHSAIIHNCTIHSYAVIGMGAIVSDYAVVGKWSVVGEGCVVKNKQIIPDEKIAVGIPAKIIGDVSEEYKTQWTKFKNIYTGLAEKRYPRDLKKIRD